MWASLNSSTLLRERAERSERVTFMELFFDLVYVFGVTQLAHFLLEHLSIHGAFQALILLLAVWWAWVYTAWLTNWFDPEHRIVRIALIAVMLGSLIMAAAIPEAFSDRSLVFAGAYVAIQVGRNLFALAALRDNPGLRPNFQRILVWFGASGLLWLAGALSPGSAREAFWVTAVAIEFAAPAAGYFVPGLGRSLTSDWAISGNHLAERCELFVMIALGESFLLIGTTFAGLDSSAATLAALAVAFACSVVLWWIYFDRSAEAAARRIGFDTDPGKLGRSAYTYFHLPMVAGIIVAAVGDELTITHPMGNADTETAAVMLGGPALFLVGYVLFKWSVFGRVPVSRLVAAGALIVLMPVATTFSPLADASAAMLVVAAAASWGAWADERGPQPSTTTPFE